MFNTQDAKHLCALFNQFNVPIFAAERSKQGAEFKMICLNRSFCEASGLNSKAAIGERLEGVFRSSDQPSIHELFHKCADTRAGLRFRHQIDLPVGLKSWDMCLQHATPPAGGDRVVAVAFCGNEPTRAPIRDITFADISYFSALADLQLQNLISIFERAQKDKLFCQDTPLQIDQLAGLCRSIQQAVHDVQNSVRHTQPHLSDGKVEIGQMRSENSSIGQETLRALCKCAEDDVTGH